MPDYTIERNAGQCRVALTGDLTASVVPELRAALKRDLEQSTSEIIFDLAHTTMLDSSGIGLLIATHNSLSHKQGKVRVVGASADIFNMLQSMRLVQRLNVASRNQEEVHHG